MEPIVIIHGWSDNAESFAALSAFIAADIGVEPLIIRLADWISLNNDVTYKDIVTAMERAWRASSLPVTPHSVNVIVHSTGALVARDWMTRYYSAGTVPIKRLLMLAPANFGSPLAHKGRSFIGRAIKGWGQPEFQTGTCILKGLELASPYTFNLAERDLFSAERWYGEGGILATVLVGNTGYSGVEAIANEAGSDGTVRISTANLNCKKLVLELDARQNVISHAMVRSNGSIAFGILNKENHSTIVLKDGGPKNELTRKLILQALQVTDADYSEAGGFPWQARIHSLDSTVNTASDQLQNVVTHVTDDLDQEVRDYFIEFYRTVDIDKRFEKQLYERFIEHVHPYVDNAAYRALYLNIKELEKITSKFQLQHLYMSISAFPLYVAGRPEKELSSHPVGYMALDQQEEGGLNMDGEQIATYFEPHTTMLVSLKIHRNIADLVFRLK